MTRIGVVVSWGACAIYVRCTCARRSSYGEESRTVIRDEKEDDRRVALEEAAGGNGVTIFDDESEGVEADTPSVQHHILQVDGVQFAILLEQFLRIDAYVCTRIGERE